MSFDAVAIRADFPIFDRKIRDGKRLVYLDSGATSQKPNVVIDAESNFYRLHNAAAHRGAHQLAEEATEGIESARRIVSDFLGGKDDEIVFTKSSTEALNLLAYSIGSAPAGNKFNLKAGDEIVVSEMEHHANLIPWQQLAARTGAVLKWFEVTPEGRLDLSNIDSIITTKTKIVALTHQSNVLGTIVPLEELVKRTHAVGAVFILDACQSVPHMPVNVAELDIDFLAFSGHKAVGPTGVGVLWGRANLLDELPPFLFGGSMIESVSMERTTFAAPPKRFEAGVPMAAQAVGMSAAADYLRALGMDNVAEHEHMLTEAALAGLADIPGLRVIGPENSVDRGSAVSFVLEGLHPHDVGQVMDESGIAVRVGQHCAKPACIRYGVQATTRATFYIYNDLEDVEALVAGIYSAKKFFGV
jgi:cysteine desulfurase/selenocysteine lyase